MEYNDAIKIGKEIYKKSIEGLSGDPIYVTVAGSHSFGLSRETSDVDLSGVYMAPIEKIMGLDFLNVQDHTIQNHTDAGGYSLQEIFKYIRLLLKCNPTIVEAAFVDLKWIIHTTPEGNALREIAPKALHSGFNKNAGANGSAYGLFSSFYGYSIDQIHKGCKKVLVDTAEARPEFIPAIPTDPKRFIAVKKIFDNPENDPLTRDLIEYINVHYDYKFFSHTLRLLSSGTHALETGEFLVIPPLRDFCFNVLNGKISLGEVIQTYIDMSAKYDTLREENALPNDPDREALEDFLLELRITRAKAYLKARGDI